MTVYWSGGGPGVLSPSAFVEIDGDNPPARPPAGTVVAVRNAETGLPITALYDATGAPTDTVETLAAGYLSFGTDDVPVVEVSADGWTTVTRLIMATALTELIAAGNGFDELSHAFGIPVTEYVKGDGSDETVALQSAVNAAKTSNRPLVCDGSLTVLISSPIDMRGDNLHVVGNGMFIRQTGNNRAGVQLGGQRQVITGLTVDYESTPSDTDTDSGAFTFWSVFEGYYANLKAERCGYGFLLAQSGWDGRTDNTCFSTCFVNLYCLGYSVGAIHMATWPFGGASSTGCTWTNLYLHNNYFGENAQSSQSPVTFVGWDESIFSQLNIEKTRTPDWGDVTFWAQCQNMVIQSMHVEGVTIHGQAAMFRIVNSTVLNVTGLSWVFSTLPADSYRKSIVSAGEQGSAPLGISILGMRLRFLNTAGTAAFALASLDSDVTTGRFTFDRVDTGPLIGPHVVGDHPAAPVVQKINDRLFGALAPDPNRLNGAQSTMPRGQVGTGDAGTLTSGTLRLAFFTAEDSFDVTQMRLISGSVAAGATPSLARAGLYSVARNGDLTLVAAIASSTNLLAAAATQYTRPLATDGGLPATYPLVAGMRYAVGLLVVTAAAAPTVPGQAISSAMTVEGGQTPRVCASLAGQSNLPANISAGSLNNSSVRPYAVLL
jgi:hypothetical protein